MKKLCLFIISMFFTLNLFSYAEASCGSSNCTLIRGSQAGLANEGRFVVDLSYRYIRMDNAKKGSGSFSGNVDVSKVEFESGMIEPAHHREFKTINELAQFDISYGITEKLTVSMSVPFLNDRHHEHIDGLPGPVPPPEFTNQDGSSGFGDITLMAKEPVLQSSPIRMGAVALATLR